MRAGFRPFVFLFFILPFHPLSADPSPVLEVYTLPGCHDCGEFEESLQSRILPALSELGVRPEVQAYDVLEPEGYERLMSETRRLSWEYRGVPLLKAGDRFFFGNELSDPELTRALADALETPGNPSGLESVQKSKVAVPDLNPWVVLGAGLVDGVNPCALATLLFLVSALALGGRGRGAAASIGAGFILGVFATYFLIGLGLLRLGSLLPALPGLRTALRVLTALGLGILGILSLRDWRAVRQGRIRDISLKMPGSGVRRMHNLIRKGAPLWVSGTGAVLLGVLVSVSEFVCTGQVYLPTLVYIAQGQNRGAMALLALYNLAFVLPLAAFFVLVLTGTSHARLTELFKKHLAAAKLVLALFFLSFGALMMFGIA